MAVERLDVLVVGGGGREHALVRSLMKSPRIGRLIGACNPGIEDDAMTSAMAAMISPRWSSLWSGENCSPW